MNAVLVRLKKTCYECAIKMRNRVMISWSSQAKFLVAKRQTSGMYATRAKQATKRDNTAAYFFP
jgi:hypothetical protein